MRPSCMSLAQASSERPESPLSCPSATAAGAAGASQGRPRRLPLPDFIHHRSLLVNCYPAVGAAQPRLDFSYYEYPDVGHFVEARRLDVGVAFAVVGDLPECAV